MQTIPKEHTISTVQNLSQQGVHKESSTAKGKMICDDDYYNHYYHYLLIFSWIICQKLRSNLDPRSNRAANVFSVKQKSEMGQEGRIWPFYFEIRTVRCVTSRMDGLDISFRTPDAGPHADTRVMDLIKEELTSTFYLDGGNRRFLQNA
jgi:hypothetical protein